MVQVVTHENIQQLIETGKVDHYKPPEAPVKVESTSADKQPEKAEVKEDEQAPEILEPGDEAYTEAIRKRIGKENYKRRQAEAAAKVAEEKATKQSRLAEVQFNERQLIQKRLDDSERKLADLQARGKPTEETEVKPPVREKFKSDEEYWEAVVDYRADQRVAAAEAKKQADAALAERAKLEIELEMNVEKFACTVDDYQETITEFSQRNARVPPALTQYVVENPDVAPAVVYHMAKNPDIFDRIAALPPTKLVLEVGKLAASLTTVEEPPKEESKPDLKLTERTRAPVPIQPVSGNQGTVHKPLSEMNTRETIEYWQAQDKVQTTKRQRH